MSEKEDKDLFFIDKVVEDSFTDRAGNNKTASSFFGAR